MSDQVQTFLSKIVDDVIAKTKNGESREKIFEHFGLTTTTTKKIVRKTKPVVRDPTTPVENVVSSTNLKSPQAPPIERNTDAPLPSGVTSTVTRVIKKAPAPVPNDVDQVDSIIASCDATSTTREGRSQTATKQRRSKSAATPTSAAADENSTAIPLQEAVRMCKEETKVTRCMRKYIIGSLSGNVCGKPGANVESVTESHEVRCVDCLKMKGGVRTSIAKDLNDATNKKPPATKRVVKKEPVVAEPAKPVVVETNDEEEEPESDHAGIPAISGAPKLTEEDEEVVDSPKSPVSSKPVVEPEDSDSEEEWNLDAIEKFRSEETSKTSTPSHNGEDLTLLLRPINGFSNMYYTRSDVNGFVCIASQVSDKPSSLKIEGVVKGNDMNGMIVKSYTPGKDGAFDRFKSNIIRLDKEDADDDTLQIAYELAEKSDVLSYVSIDGSTKELQAETPS